MVVDLPADEQLAFRHRMEIDGEEYAFDYDADRAVKIGFPKKERQ